MTRPFLQQTSRSSQRIVPVRLAALDARRYPLPAARRLTERSFDSSLRHRSSLRRPRCCAVLGHATHQEIYRLAEEVDKVGLNRAVIDHPYSPFLNVSPEMMKELAPLGILFNFTWDELSPLLGVDPQIMYNTIREVGFEHFTLSSDAGEPIFPDSVEAMRLVRGYLEAFGLSQDELYTVCTKNPAKVEGLEL